MIVEVVVTMVLDVFPKLNTNWLRKAAVVFSICFISFLFGLPMCTGVGFSRARIASGEVTQLLHIASNFSQP